MNMTPELKRAYAHACKARRSGEKIALEDADILIKALQNGELRSRHVDFLHRGHTRPVYGVRPSAFKGWTAPMQRRAIKSL